MRQLESLNSQQGSAVMIVLSWTVLLLFLGMAVDYGIVMRHRRVLQNACDAAALAGAVDLAGSRPQTEVQQTAAAFARHGTTQNNMTLRDSDPDPQYRDSLSVASSASAVHVSIGITQNNVRTYFYRLGVAVNCTATVEGFALCAVHALQIQDTTVTGSVASNIDIQTQNSNISGDETAGRNIQNQGTTVGGIQTENASPPPCPTEAASFARPAGNPLGDPLRVNDQTPTRTIDCSAGRCAGDNGWREVLFEGGTFSANTCTSQRTLIIQTGPAGTTNTVSIGTLNLGICGRVALSGDGNILFQIHDQLTLYNLSRFGVDATTGAHVANRVTVEMPCGSQVQIQDADIVAGTFWVPCTNFQSQLSVSGRNSFYGSLLAQTIQFQGDAVAVGAGSRVLLSRSPNCTAASGCN